MSDGQEADEPDSTLADGRGEGELTAHVAGNSMYASAASFEDLPLSPELLQVCDVYSAMPALVNISCLDGWVR